MNDLLKDEDIWGAATAPESPTLSDADIWGGSAPATGEQGVLSDADIWGGSAPPAEVTPAPVADRKIINGREFRAGKESGLVFDDKNKIVDDPQILEAFGISREPGVTDYASELGRSTVRGVAGAAASTGKGLNVLTSDNAAEIARVEQGIANLKNMSAEEATAFMRELPSTLSPAVAFNYQVAIRKLWRGDKEGAQSYLDQARRYTDTRPVEEQGLTVAGKKLEEAASKAFPQDPRFKGSITSDIGQAAGSSLFFLPIGLLTGGTGVAVTGAAAGAAESYDTAKADIENGDFRDDRGGMFNAGYGTAAETAALGAGRLGAIPGASEVVPTEIFLEQMPKYIPGLRTIANTPAWGRFAKAFGRVGTQVLSEGGQEAFQTWAGNLINQLKINPSQDITEDVLYNALLGGVVGGGMQTGVEGYNAVFGKDEPGPNNGGPINVSPAPGTPGGQRIEPTLFPGSAPQGQQAAPPPGSPPPGAPPAEAPISDDAWLMGAGYTAEQIGDMNPEERAAAVEEAQAQGVEPVDFMAGAPQPGTAPMAPRGTRRDKVNVQSEQDLEQVRPTVNAEPSPAQAAAGNYQKGHIKIHGFDVSIENPRGSVRRGTDEDGAEWASPELPADYGYIKGTTGKDGDHVDVYIGSQPESDRIFVIDQVNPKTGEFDEHKAVMGAASSYDAVDLYTGSFDNPTDDPYHNHTRIGAVTEMTVDEFRDWVKKGRNTKRPAADSGVGQVMQRAPKAAPAEAEGRYPTQPDGNSNTVNTVQPTADDFDAIFQQELDAEFGPQPATNTAANLDEQIDTAPAPAPKKRKYGAPTPVNVLDFIASIGGISDPTGELKGMDLPKMTRFGPVLRKTGLHPDKVREALVERGFLTDRGFGTDLQASTTENDVYDLIAQHMGGQRVYAPEDQAKADAIATTRAAEAQNPDLEGVHPIVLRWGQEVWDQVQAVLELQGLDEDAWSPQEVNDAARMISEGMDPEQAFERAYATHVAELEDMPEIAPEIAAAFEKNRANAMVVFDPPPFPDVETADNAAQQQDLPEAGDGLVADGEAGPDARGEAEVRGAGPESAGARPDGAEAGSAGLADEEVRRPRRNAIGSNALEDALLPNAREKLAEWFKKRNASRDLRRVREGMEVYQRLLDGGFAEEADELRKAANGMLNFGTPEWFAKFEDAVWTGLQTITGEEDPDPAELLENEVFATAADAGELIFQTLDPKTASFDVEEFNTAFGDVEFRRDKDKVFPPVKKQVRIWKDVGRNRISQDEADAEIAKWKEHARRIGREEDHSKEVILSLFDVTGQWSQPYRDAGYKVIQYDIKSGNDLMKFGDWMADVENEINEGDKTIVGILAAPPCTTFASSGARWWADVHDKADKKMIEKTFGKVWAADFFETPVEYANALVAVVKLIVEQADPKFYAMENPVGRIQSQNQLPDPLLAFDPNNFGNPYTKRTLLWGEFNTDLPTANVEPTLGSLIHKLRGDDPKQKAQRSETPDGFAYAFFMANNTSELALEDAPQAPSSRADDYVMAEDQSGDPLYLNDRHITQYEGDPWVNVGVDTLRHYAETYGVKVGGRRRADIIADMKAAGAKPRQSGSIIASDIYPGEIGQKLRFSGSNAVGAKIDPKPELVEKFKDALTAHPEAIKDRGYRDDESDQHWHFSISLDYDGETYELSLANYGIDGITANSLSSKKGGSTQAKSLIGGTASTKHYERFIKEFLAKYPVGKSNQKESIAPKTTGVSLDALEPQDQVRITLRQPITEKGETYGPVIEGEYMTQAGMHFVAVKGKGLLPATLGPIDPVDVVSLERTKDRAQVFEERYSAGRGEAFNEPLTRTRDGYENWLRAIAKAITEAKGTRRSQLTQQMDDVADEIGLAKKKRKWLLAEAAYRKSGGKAEYPSRNDLAAGSPLDALRLQRPKPSDFEPSPEDRRARSREDDPTAPKAMMRRIQAAGFGAMSAATNPDGSPDTAKMLVTMPGGKENGRALVTARQGAQGWRYSVEAYAPNDSKAQAARVRKMEASPEWKKLTELLREVHREAAEEASTEKGADNKQQLVIPGAERDQKGALNNAAKAPLKGSVPQKGMDLGLFGSERDQTDMFDKPQPKKAEAKADTGLAQQIRDKFVIFSSGMSRLKDFLSGAYTTGTLSTRGIGVDVQELSDDQIKPMAKKIVEWQTQVFIDSGAFGVFKRNMKERVKYENALIDLFERDGAEAPELEEISDAQLLTRYDQIANALSKASEAEGEADYPQPLYVAPDVVGDQAGSIALVKKHAKWINLRLDGGRQIIVPIQKGEKNLAEAFEAVAEILGRRDFIVGVPSNAKAVTDAEFAAFVKAAKPPKLHFLGTTDPAKIEPRIEAIAAAGYVPDHVSSDANMLRALLYGRSDVTETRDEGIRRVIKDRSPEFGELAGSEPDDMFSEEYLTEQGRTESFDDVFAEELDAEFGEKPQKANLQGNWWEPLMGGEEKPKKKGGRTAGQAAASAAKNTAKGMGEIVQGLEALFGSKKKLNSGFTFDEESYAKALPLFKAAVTHLGEAISDMREVVRALIKKFREAGMSRDALEGMQPYLKRFAEDVTAGKISLTEDAPAQQQGKFHPLVEAFVDYLSQPDAAFDTITEARKFAKDRGFDAKPGTPEAKDLDEKLELAIVLTARTLVGASKKRPPKTAYRRLVDLYNRQPNLGVRTSESMADQAYSTPAPLAFIASRLAGVAGAKSVMEPTAGNGMLLIEADPKNATVNEINDRRAAALKAQGFRVTQLDAATERLRHKGYPVEAIIENPPFGAVRESDGGSKTFTVDGWNTTQIDHAIALNSLENLAENGRAVLIVGSVKEGTDKSRSDAYNTKQKREFYWRLYQSYNVTDHFTVSGDLYKRQGAGWPVDVIVIEGRGKSVRPLPAVELPKVYDTWESLEEKLDEAPAQAQPGTRPQDAGTAVSRPAGVGDVAEDGNRLEGGSTLDQSPDGGRRPAAVSAPARGEGSVPDGGNQREPAGLGEQQLPEPDGGAVAPGERAERDGDRQPPVPGRERLKQDAEAAQQPYKPMSSQPALDTKIPTNMADAVETSLGDLSDRYGELDSWVEKELGYKKGEIGKYLAAEQVDAVALALDNVKKNAAFIIGDQTGIGKGRVVASALRYAIRNKLVPIFVTEKPNLYGDIIRDLNDIGVPQMLGRDLKPFLTNAGEAIPLDDEAVAWYDEAQRAKAEGGKPPEKRGKFLRASGGDLHKRQMAALQKDGTGKDFDIIFTTYDQLNTVKGQPTDRRRLVEGLADRAFIVLDESHNAGGTEASERAAKNAPESRSDFLKKVTAKAKAVMFSSATYAKRPGVMALYARTDMGKAVEKPEMLGALIERGGVPMQQVVAAMLAKAGQYIRRERSFDGVSYDVEPVSVDIKAYEAVSTSLSAIARFDINLKKDDTFKEIKEKLKEDAEAIGMDSGTGGASVNSTNFTSLMHNIVNQMLLAIKSDAVASRAIEALKAGEKPVITVANTMGAFLKTYAEDHDIKIGDAVDLSFRDVLGRYLERTRRLTIKRPDGTIYHYMIPLSALPSDLLAAYREAERLIAGIDTANLPISPIDWLRFRIQKAGYRVSEITGRKETLEYAGPDNATFAQRMDAEVSPAGRRVNIDKFNRGDLDVMILNRAGSTGLSLHASSKFKDQRRRRMIIAQAELNIDVHMQMLGRVHRTGQVIPPAFVQAYADVPAEARPAAVLAKKMASLNANTTASRKSAFSADDSVDFLNDYGDQVAREFLTENPEINELLDVSLDPEKETARELTGRLLLLPVADQRRALEEITARYKVLIENLDAMGENALEAKTIDLGAKTIGRQELKPAEGDSPFTQAVILEETEVKAQGKALPLPEIIERAAEALGAGKVSAENPESALNELERVGRISKAAHFKKWYDDFDRMADDEIKVTKNEDLKTKRREAHTENRYRFARITDMVMPGRRVVVKAKDGSPLTGIVMKVSRRGQSGATGNPLALGAWSAEIAIPDNAQRITVPFSSLALPGDTVGEAERKVFIEEPDWANGIKQTVEAFENARKTGKETRYIVTGNILAGFDQTHGQGQIVNYTDDQGNVKPGILMSKTFSPKAFLDQRAVRFKTAAQVLAFLKKMPQAEISSHDEIITVRRADSWTEIEMPAARQSGGTYFLNPDVRKAAYDQFTKVGSRMRYKTNLDESVTRVLDAMMQAGAVFQTTEQQEVAEEIITGKKPDAPKQAPLSSRAQGRLSSAKGKPVFYSGLLRAVEGLKLDKAPKAQWMGTIRNAPGVKPEEIAWIGLEGWLAEQGGLVTKAEIADFIRANQVEVQETLRGHGLSPNTDIAKAKEWLTEKLGKPAEEAYGYSDESDYVTAAIRRGWMPEEAPNAPKFEKYQLKGGDNYRELLLTLPDRAGEQLYSGYVLPSNDMAADGILTDISAEGLEEAFDYGRVTGADGVEYIEFNGLSPSQWEKVKQIVAGNGEALSQTIPGPEGWGNTGNASGEGDVNYRSSHFPEKNILAHVRFNERTDTDGKRVLFIEEIQSDWHQTGRKRGYKLPLSKEEGEALVEERRKLLRVNDPKSAGYDELTSDQVAQNEARIEEINRRIARSNGVPDAPFKTSWPELAMKRMIRWAAENGFDRIAWTPGEMQADRYGQTHYVKKLRLITDNETGIAGAIFNAMEGDRENFAHRSINRYVKDEKTISDLVGPELTQKLLAVEPRKGTGNNRNGWVRELVNLDLKLGGEGMKGFYDKILVDTANRLGKKWGTRVGTAKLPFKPAFDMNPKLFNPHEVHSLDIPAEMKAAAMEGQPLFKRREQAKVPTEPKPTKRNPYRFVISQKQTAALVHEIGQIAERILGHRLASISIVTDQEAWNETFGPEEDAVFDPNTGVIYLALHGTQDLRSTLRHEAVHALRQAGVIRAQEWAVLSRMAQTRWIDQYKIRDRYEQLYRERFDITDAEIEQLLIEEAVADAMAEHWTQAPSEDVVGRIFARIKAFLAAVRAMLLRRGYTSAEEIAAANHILENIERGGMSSRREGTGQGRDFMLYARQSEQAPLSSRRRLSPARNPAPGSFDAPHDERVRRALADSTDTILNRLKRAGRAFGNEFRRKAQDREVDLLRTQTAIEQANGGPLAEPQNAYLAASLYPGRVAQRDKDLVEDVIEPLVKDIARRGLSLEEVNDFVMARHAIERNLEVGQLHPPGSDFHEAMTNPAIVGASGMSENEANDILNDAQASGKFADLEAVGDEIVALNRRTLAKLYSEGLITQDQYDALTQKYQYYVPLRGWDDVTDESNPDSPRTGRRYDVRGKEFQQAFGRSSKADSPLAYSILQARQALIRIEKNRVGKRFLRLAQANPNEAFWEVNRVDLKKVIDPTTGYVRNVFDRGAAEAENVYAVKVGGKRYNITLHHEGLLRAMKGIGGENMGELVGVFHKINRFFAAINTSYDPEFIFRNFLRDVQQAGIVLQEERARGLARRVIASIPKAAYGMNKMLAGDLSSQWARFAREFADAGGKIGFMDRNDIDAEKRNLERLMKQATSGWTGKTLRAANEMTLERLARYNDTIENTLRLATYVQLRRAGATKDRAAFVARELTVNFNRKGEWGPALNAFYLFYNASMQGAASLFMRLGRSRKMKMVAAGLIVEAFLMDMLNRMIGGDDDDDKNRYDKIPAEEKARNHIFMMPKWVEDQYGVPYFKVPLPLGWNWFNVVGQQASQAVAGVVTPLEAFGNIAGTFADSFNPLGSGGFLNTFAPTLLDPFVEIGTNRDFFNETIVPKQFDETTPYAERYKPNVNPAAKWLTDTLSSLTGGSPERAGAIDLSPEWVEHLADFTFGGLGRFFTRSMTTVESWVEGEESDKGKVPFQRIFVGRDSTFADRDEYFQIRDAVHVTEKELKARIAEGNREAAAEVRRNYARELKMMNLMDAAEKQLGKLRKEYKTVKNAQRMGEATRAKRLEAISQRMDEIQRKVRSRWHQLGEDVETSPSSSGR